MESTQIHETETRAVEENNDKNLAMLAHLGGIFFGFVPALIIFLIKKSDLSAHFVTVQSKEALNFQITVAIAIVISTLLIMVLIGTLFLFIVGIANIVFSILAAVETSKSENYRYPISLRLIK